MADISRDTEEPKRARKWRQERRHEAGRIEVTKEDDVTGKDAQDKGAHTGKWRRDSGRARRDA